MANNSQVPKIIDTNINILEPASERTLTFRCWIYNDGQGNADWQRVPTNGDFVFPATILLTERRMRRRQGWKVVGIRQIILNNQDLFQVAIT